MGSNSEEKKLSNTILGLLSDINREEKMHFDYVSDELWNVMNRLSVELEAADDESKCEVIDFLYCKIDYMKPVKSVLYYSLIMDLTKTHEDVFNFLQYIRTNPFLSANEKFFLHYQIKSVIFRKFKESFAIVTKENWMLFRDITDEYRNIFSGKYDYIDEKDRNKDFVVVIIGQILSIKHGPTKTILDRCHTMLHKLKKKVLIVNTAEVLTQVGLMPYINNMVGNYDEEYSERTSLEWKNDVIPFFQCEHDTPNEAAVDMIMNMIQERKPYFIVNVGGSSVIASLLNMQVPVLSVGLGPSTLDTIETEYQTLGRKLTNDDREILRYVGKHESHVIEGLFTSGLKEQKSKLTKADLGINNEDFVICVIGMRLDEEADNAFYEMLENVTNDRTTVVFAGLFSGEQKIQKYSKLKGHFKYVGMMEDILGFLEACDLYINPRRSGGGTSAAEALSKGIPVITQRFGDVYVGTGDVFAVDDYSEMGRLIEKYREDRAFYQTMSEKAKARAALLLDSDASFVEILKEMARREHIDL